jgi:NADP-dependent 3-hydroxy acid dehydrogenase YdfG
LDKLDKTILITGATSGIGEATARLLRAKWPSARLLLTGRRAERLERLQAELKAEVFVLDIRDREAVGRFASSLEGVNVLVNNAGLAAGLDTFQEASLDDWEEMIDTNVKGLLYVTRALLPKMIAAGSGHIVNIGSVAGRQVYPKGHVYNATKFAVHALTEALRLDVQGMGIRVTEIQPGMVETEFSKVRFKGDEAKAKSVYSGLKPLKPEDVAEAIFWSLNQPPHVNVQELLLMPTDQASVRDAFRK